MSDGGQAFPSHPALYSTAKQSDAQGMSLRGWFAGQAIASIPTRNWDDLPSDQDKINAWAKCAYAVADAMLAQRLPQGSEQ